MSHSKELDHYVSDQYGPPGIETRVSAAPASGEPTGVGGPTGPPPMQSCGAGIGGPTGPPAMQPCMQPCGAGIGSSTGPPLYPPPMQSFGAGFFHNTSTGDAVPLTPTGCTPNGPRPFINFANYAQVLVGDT